MKRLNIIGCGNVGKTLGRLWHQRGVFEIHDILNRTAESACRAVDFIGAGRGIFTHADMRPADVYMISAGDDCIAPCCEALAASGLIREGTVVFHCSGALPSSILAAIAEKGGVTASIHPVRSFADPCRSVETFAGTWCGVEGDERALPILAEALVAIGAAVFPVDMQFKTIYHAASVMVCNYLAALMEVGMRTYEKGGLDRVTALRVMEPLVRGTVDNIFRLGPAKALTGPVARGDHGIVARQYQALKGWDPEIAALYKSLGRFALDLSRQQGTAPAEGLAALEVLLAAREK